MQRVAGAQPRGMLIRVPRRRPESARVTGQTSRLSSASSANAESTSARSDAPSRFSRNFIDSAAENSVTTQSLIAIEPAGRVASQCCAARVMVSWVSAATRRLVSR